MAIATMPFSIMIDHDGKQYEVFLPNLSAPKCQTCGEISLDDAASEQIDLAFREKAQLLTPAQIRDGRLRAGFQQQGDFARCLGIAVATLARWENGAQVQQHFHDGILRAFFEVSPLRSYLAKLHGVEPAEPIAS